MARKKKVTDARMIEAIQLSRGMVATAARNLGCNRQTIYNRAKESEAVADAIEEAREITLDTAETKLFELIQEKNLGAICFLLKCLGKKRGYIEREYQQEEPEPVQQIDWDAHLEKTQEERERELNDCPLERRIRAEMN